MYAKSNVETYITICKIDSQWEFAVCFRKPQNRGSVSTWRGGIMVIRLVCTHLAALLDHLIPTTTLGGRLLSSHIIDEETGTPGG